MNIRAGTAHVFAMTIMTLALPSHALAQGTGYVWANDSAANEYAPDSAYSYNSAAGKISIARNSVGAYTVRFSGLGGNGKAGGNVQVTAYGKGSEICKVEKWDSFGADFIVVVRCFSAAGMPVDAQYSMSVISPAVIQADPFQSQYWGSQGAGGWKPHIKADGTVEYRDSKGNARKPRTASEISARPPIPPSAPDETQLAWLERHSAALLNVIRELVDNDPTSYSAFTKFEADKISADIYAKIKKREEIITQLVAIPIE